MTKELFSPDHGGTPPADPGVNYYEQLVGEGKKYSSNEKAAKALVDKDTYITKLENENQVLSENTTKIDSILDKISSNELPKDPPPSSDPADGTVPKVTIADMIQAELDQRSAAQKADDNARIALTKLTEYYGDTAAAKSAVSKTVAADKDTYLKLASTDPESFVTLVKAKVAIESNTSDPLHNNPGSNAPSTGQFIPWSEAKKTLSSDRRKYNSHDYQKQIDASQAYFKSKGVDYYTT